MITMCLWQGGQFTARPKDSESNSLFQKESLGILFSWRVFHERIIFLTSYNLTGIEVPIKFRSTLNLHVPSYEYATDVITNARDFDWYA